MCSETSKHRNKKEENALFNDAFNTFCGARCSSVVRAFAHGAIGCWMEGRKEMFYLTMHSTHFIYHYMVLDIW